MNALERASQAKQLMDNPIFRESFIAIKADLIDQWSRRTVWSGWRKREKIWAMMQGVNDFEALLSREIESGKMAAAREDKANKVSKLHRSL